MKQANKLIVLVIAAATATAGFAGLANADRSQGRGGAERGTMMLEMFDSNGDGTVTIEEARAVQTDRMTRFDVNGDGGLTLQEFEALFAELAHPRMVDGFQRLDADGDGVVTADEMDAPMTRMAQRMDTDGDGDIDRDDRPARGGARHGGDRDTN
jgi:Ca2+-binding EF-hand superfamily protein